MSKYIPGNQKHLTLEDRVYIENELAKGTSFKNIAAFLCKDPTTISKEVRAHRLSERMLTLQKNLQLSESPEKKSQPEIPEELPESQPLTPF